MQNTRAVALITTYHGVDEVTLALALGVDAVIRVHVRVVVGTTTRGDVTAFHHLNVKGLLRLGQTTSDGRRTQFVVSLFEGGRSSPFGLLGLHDSRQKERGKSKKLHSVFIFLIVVYMLYNFEKLNLVC